MAPFAQGDDGLLDIILCKSNSRLKLLGLLDKVYDGKHVFDKSGQYYRGK